MAHEIEEIFKPLKKSLNRIDWIEEILYNCRRL